MNKKFLSLVLALVMVLGTFGSVFAETKAPEAKDAKKSEVKVPEKKETNEKVQWLVDNEIVVGRKVNKDDKNADLALDKDIQRAEVTKLLIYAIGQQDLAARLNGVYAPYTDVPSNHWANGLIAAGSTVASPANALPFLHGIGHNMFQPERQVRYDELAKMLVVLVKKDLTKDGLAAAKWPTDWMNWAAQLGIFDGIKTPVDGSKPAVRQDAFVMLYNALYRIGGLRNLPARETIGVISDASVNKLTLNQGDFKKEYTVTANTNFVPAKYTEAANGYGKITWANFVYSQDEYYIGSLVRVITDEKGNVSHIIQLGNPEHLALDTQGWVAIAENTVETKKGTTVNLGNLSEITFAKDNSKVNDKDAKADVVVKTNSATRYFVADKAKNQLTEVKDKAAALALIENRRAKGYADVYVGYDTLKNSKLNEAKVVVLGDVDVDNHSSDIVRIVTPGTNNYTTTAQKPGKTETKVESFDLMGWKAGWPLNFGLEQQDVVEYFNDHYKMIIDHSEANIYKVVDVNKEEIQGLNKVNGRKVAMKLTDGYGTRKVDIVADAKLFFGDRIEKGAFVQVRFVNETATVPAVDIVSVVNDRACRGFLPYGVDNGMVTGVIASKPSELAAGGFHVFTVNVIEDGKTNPYPVAFATTEKLEELKKADGQAVGANDLVGKTIVFKATKATNQTHGLALATNVALKEVYDAKVEADKALDDAKAALKKEPVKILPASQATPPVVTQQELNDAIKERINNTNVTFSAPIADLKAKAENKEGEPNYTAKVTLNGETITVDVLVSRA